MTAATWRWDEVPDPPKGLDVAGLGQVPHLHAGRYYVKHPHDGRVLGATNIVNIKADPLVLLGDTLTQLATDLGKATPGSIPAAILADVSSVQTAFAGLQTEVFALRTQLAAAKSAATATAVTPPPAAAPAKPWTGGQVAITAVSTGLLGFAGGMLTSWGLIKSDIHERESNGPTSAPSSR